MFYEPTDFELTKTLERDWQIILEEYLALPDDAFDPWVQQSMHGQGWSVFGLIAGGFQLPGCQSCPRTTEILMSFGNVGLAGFSRMAPQTHILPHQGWAANEYRLHLGLVVPEGCRLRVLDETRNWEAGKCLIFDDTALHEAWNNSNQMRANLMVDFLRPGMTEFSINNVPSNVVDYAKSLLGIDDGQSSEEGKNGATRNKNGGRPENGSTER